MGPKLVINGDRIPTKPKTKILPASILDETKEAQRPIVV